MPCPADDSETRVRVAAALSLLAVSKGLNINVPIILKLAVDCLAGGEDYKHPVRTAIIILMAILTCCRTSYEASVRSFAVPVA